MVHHAHPPALPTHTHTQTHRLGTINLIPPVIWSPAVYQLYPELRDQLQAFISIARSRYSRYRDIECFVKPATPAQWRGFKPIGRV